MKIKVEVQLNVLSGFYCDNKRYSCSHIATYPNSNRKYCSLFNRHLQVTNKGYKKCKECLLTCHEQCGDER